MLKNTSNLTMLLLRLESKAHPFYYFVSFFFIKKNMISTSVRVKEFEIILPTFFSNLRQNFGKK